ncbi:MAG: hypothetical protein WBB97_04870 [Dehalococcoidales bacterium]
MPRILIPIIALALLLGGCGQKQEAKPMLMPPPAFEPIRLALDATVHLSLGEFPDSVLWAVAESVSVYTINMADFDETIPPRWHWEYRWVMMECLKSDLGSGIEYAVYIPPDTCWQQERYKVYEPCDSILDQPCLPCPDVEKEFITPDSLVYRIEVKDFRDTLYQMPPGRWVKLTYFVIEGFTYCSWPWEIKPDSAYILSKKGE